MRTGTARTIILVATMAAIGVSIRVISSATEQGSEQTASPGSDVFTPAHKSFLDAVLDYFDYHRAPQQPIAFIHKVHLANGMECVNCHVNVEKGAIASIPNIKFCMSCHQVVATDKPEIKKMTAMLARGEDIPWKRVFDYSPTLHVHFNHAPHIRASVDCATCHGDMRQRTVAVRDPNMNMGFCINCHKARKASVECTTCHF